MYSVRNNYVPSGGELTEILRIFNRHAHNILYWGPLMVTEATAVVVRHHTDGKAPKTVPPAK